MKLRVVIAGVVFGLASIDANASPTRQDNGCPNGRPNRTSEICAAWSAADAAVESAHWTQVGIWVSGISGVFVLIALAFAFEANQIARRTAKRQLRAYVSVEPGGISKPEKGLHSAPLNLINSGQTPAYNMELGGDFIIMEGDPRNFDPKVHGRLTGAAATTDATLGANTNRFTYAYLEEELCKPLWEKIKNKEAAIIHYGFLRYTDAFKTGRQTNFAFYHWGEVLSDVESKRCRFGNDST
jgi:hypothetical protein